MKKMFRLTAVLLGAVMLGSAVPVMPVSAEDTGSVQTEADASQDGCTVFLERIAGWENAALADCVILENDMQLTLLTPAKPYFVNMTRYLPYLVYLNDGSALDADTLTAKWKDRLQKTYAEEYLKRNDIFDSLTCTVEQSGDCWLVSPSADNAYTDYLLAVLKDMPNVQRIEAKCSYHTHDRVNTSGGYNLLFTGDGKNQLTPEDFPELTGVTLTEQIPMTGTTYSTWILTLESGTYADYFAAAKYLQTLSFVKNLSLGHWTTCLADESPESYYMSDNTTVLFDRAVLTGTRTEFFERIAGWQNAALADCVILGEDELLTPDKPYTISKVRFTPYRVSTQGGVKPDADAINEKWKEMLRTAGYPQASLDRMYCEVVTEADGCYEITALQDGYAGITLVDCLKTFPDVQRVEAQFGYRTDSRPNHSSNYVFRFKVNGTDMPQPDDFPELTGVQIAGDVPRMTQTESTWSLTLQSGKYADYVAAAQYLLTLDFVQDLKLGFVTTEMAALSDDAKIRDPEPTVLFDRAADSASLTDHTRDAFFKCITSRENVLYDSCIRLGEDQLLTPNKPYTISRFSGYPYRAFLREGGTLSADALLAKRAEIQLAEGSAKQTILPETVSCELREAGGGYDIITQPAAFGTDTLLKCLKSTPDVQRVEAYSRYRSDDFANDASDFSISFRTVIECEFHAESFPELDISELKYDETGKIHLKLKSDEYADYFAAVKYLMTKEDVCSLSLNYARTTAALQEEPVLTDTVPNVLFNRGDLDLDGSADVADAVLLARYLASDAEAVVTDQGLVNADADADGNVRDADLTILLQRIAKKF